YKVDYSRVNEFGQGGDEEEEDEKKAAQPLKTSPDAGDKPKAAIEAAKDNVAKVSGAAKSEAGRKRK
ncbi:hypothetical protein LTS18_003644, partial [Coniosporium uncinatum]